MFEGKTVGVVIPCYNERTQIEQVLETMPDYVDCSIVVDDGSTDGTPRVVRDYIARAPNGHKIVLLEQPNSGVGRAISNGYVESARRGMKVTAVMAGDGQMDPKQLRMVIAPVARGEADYAKGNRLFYRRAWEMIPRKRYLGNAFLSMLTKIASGYWQLADSQTGYTAITSEAIGTIDINALYPRYGYPNDLLVRLNVYNFRVAEVPLRPVYGVGEQSKMRLLKVMPRMSWLIFKRFFWRMWMKYVIHDFHPLVFFYMSAIGAGALGLLLFVRMIWMWAATGEIPPINAMAWMMCTISMIQFALFAMWFDMQMNRDLTILIRRPMDESNKQEAPAQKDEVTV
jgi:glycosyltransferase involved in cell wall biosynthesis